MIRGLGRTLFLLLILHECPDYQLAATPVKGHAASRKCNAVARHAMAESPLQSLAVCRRPAPLLSTPVLPRLSDGGRVSLLLQHHQAVTCSTAPCLGFERFKCQPYWCRLCLYGPATPPLPPPPPSTRTHTCDEKDKTKTGCAAPTCSPGHWCPNHPCCC